MYVFTGFVSPLHAGVYVSGHFNDLAAVAHSCPLRVLPRKACGSRGLPHCQVIEMTKPFSANSVMRGCKPYEYIR